MYYDVAILLQRIQKAKHSVTSKGFRKALEASIGTWSSSRDWSHSCMMSIYHMTTSGGDALVIDLILCFFYPFSRLPCPSPQQAILAPHPRVLRRTPGEVEHPRPPFGVIRVEERQAVHFFPHEIGGVGEVDSGGEVEVHEVVAGVTVDLVLQCSISCGRCRGRDARHLRKRPPFSVPGSSH